MATLRSAASIVTCALSCSTLTAQEFFAPKSSPSESEAPPPDVDAPAGPAAPAVEGTKIVLPQDPPPADPPARPKYQFLRHAEDWSGLRDVDLLASDDPWDRIKHVSLSDDDTVWVSFGGHARARFESWSSFNFGAPAGADHHDAFLLTRLQLHADVHVGDHLRVFAEFKNANSTGRDLPGGNRTLDVDSAALQQMFVDVRVPIVPNGPTFTLRPGRQELLFGRQRLVSPLPWGNTLRTWDGVSAILETEGFKLTGFVTQFAPVRKYQFNTVNRTVDFYGAYINTELPTTGHAWDLYFLGLERDSATFNGTSGQEDRFTFGTRVAGQLTERDDFEVKAAWQTGKVGVEDISAFMVTGVLGHKFDAPFGGRIWAGFDYASGDSTPGGEVETFNQLFPLGHAYLGYIDAIGRQNIIDGSLGISAKPMAGLTGNLAVHGFWRAEDSDALYGVGGGVSRAATSSPDTYVGTEIDLTFKYAASRHTSWLFGYSHFFVGDVIEDSGSDDDIDFAYTSVTYTF